MAVGLGTGCEWLHEPHSLAPGSGRGGRAQRNSWDSTGLDLPKLVLPKQHTDGSTLPTTQHRARQALPPHRSLHGTCLSQFL